MTRVGIFILLCLGYLRHTLRYQKITRERNRDGYPPLYDRFSSVYVKYIFRRMLDCFNYPICSAPGVQVVLKERVTRDHCWTFKFTGNERKCLNLSSFNYLGFSDSSGACTEMVIAAAHKYGISTGSTRQQYGTCKLHVKLERLLAEFLGVDDAVTFGMGFATNVLNIPTLLSSKCLVLSDERNHASLILGSQLSGASFKIFRHNDMADLEKILREQICTGQPNQPKNVYKPWKKIFIMVEGVYSMDGTIACLPDIIALKKKYKVYLYVDEAHSIGTIGKNGKGVVSYFGCDPQDVDVLMGSFTKSFGSSGGYIAGSKKFITYLRQNSYASKYAFAMSPPVAAQNIAVLRSLMGKDGTNIGQKKVQLLTRNARYFRRCLAQIGMIIYGCEDAPLVPILVHYNSKVAIMVRKLNEMNIAVSGVIYPGVPLMESRLRVCLSAAHSKEQLDYALNCFSILADAYGLRYLKAPKDLSPIEY